jgi:hypothetical protein
MAILVRIQFFQNGICPPVVQEQDQQEARCAEIERELGQGQRARSRERKEEEKQKATLVNSQKCLRLGYWRVFL